MYPHPQLRQPISLSHSPWITPVSSSSFVGCSLMEQKTDWLKGSSGEIIRRLKDRENSALDYKL